MTTHQLKVIQSNTKSDPAFSLLDGARYTANYGSKQKHLEYSETLLI